MLSILFIFFILKILYIIPTHFIASFLEQQDFRLTPLPFKSKSRIWSGYHRSTDNSFSIFYLLQIIFYLFHFNEFNRYTYSLLNAPFKAAGFSVCSFNLIIVKLWRPGPAWPTNNAFFLCYLFHIVLFNFIPTRFVLRINGRIFGLLLYL